MGTVIFSTLLVTLLLMQFRAQLAFWAASTHYQFMLNFLPTNASESFSSGLFLIHSLPSLYLFLGLSQTISLFELQEDSVSLFHFPVPAPMRGITFWCISLTSCFVLSMKLLKVHSIPLSKSLMKPFNRTGPSRELWNIACMSRFYLDLVLLITVLWAWLFSFTVHLSRILQVTL